MDASGLQDAALPRGLSWPGRLFVAAALAGGVAVGALSGLGLVFFVPFAAVGALLSVRRPDSRIGWILLTLAWCFALSTALSTPYMDRATTELIAGTAGFVQSALTVGAWMAPGAIFYVLAVLALTFPDGRMPSGRWATPTRAVFGAGLGLVLLVTFRPVMLLSLPGDAGTVAVRNPIGILPGLPLWEVIQPETALYLLLLLVVGTAVSLVVRFRRAVGIERQQLRWFVASLVFVVLSVVLGLVIALLLPASWDKGVVWYPATAAFVTVPIAIGIAVLRYRLYEIDTIINRAVVYGLLTAILAGVSAVTVALGQKVFQGVLGAGSEGTVLVATLVVVTVFTPIKNRLQTIVDRRFKEAHDPAVDLTDFTAEAHRALGPLDPDRTLRRFLEVAVTAYGASGGEVRIAGSDGGRTLRVGPDGDAPTAGVSATLGDRAVTIELAGTDQSRDVAPLRAALAAILGELAGLT